MARASKADKEDLGVEGVGKQAAPAGGEEQLAGQQAIDDLVETVDEVPGDGQFPNEAPRDENGVPVPEQPVQQAAPVVQTDTPE